MLKPYTLRLLTATATAACVCMSVRHTVLCGALYTACVDASRTVFWDRSNLTRVSSISQQVLIQYHNLECEIPLVIIHNWVI